MKFLVLIALLFSINVSAHQHSFNTNTSTSNETSSILINTDILEHLNYNYDKNIESFGVVNFHATERQLEEIHDIAHEKFNRCGGYELVTKEDGLESLTELTIQNYESQIKLMYFSPSNIQFNFKSEILSATEELDSDNLKETVLELSSFNSRGSKSDSPNDHVELMKDNVDYIIADSPLEITSELIDHSRTEQQTLKVRIEGTQRPSEIIVLGGHLDSRSRFRSPAPGADDNASGSANLLEILRVLSQQKAPERTIEFFWYAAEEIGLIGSAEIAKEYKANNIDMVAAMQLDMTGFAGSGVFNIANVTDYTSPWLQQTLLELNKHYAGAIVHESSCGYGCSDHASWFRQGYDTVFPIEAKFRQSNKNIHTKRDTIDKLNFEHSLVFAKLGLAFAMELANSELRGPE